MSSIFEGIADLRTQCLFGVTIVCDVSQGGMKNVGPNKIEKKLKEAANNQSGCNVPFYDQFIEFAVEA